MTQHTPAEELVEHFNTALARNGMCLRAKGGGCAAACTGTDIAACHDSNVLYQCPSMHHETEACKLEAAAAQK
jgi:hypothetical protein